LHVNERVFINVQQNHKQMRKIRFRSTTIGYRKRKRRCDCLTLGTIEFILPYRNVI